MKVKTLKTEAGRLVARMLLASVPRPDKGESEDAKLDLLAMRSALKAMATEIVYGRRGKDGE